MGTLLAVLMVFVVAGDSLEESAETFLLARLERSTKDQPSPRTDASKLSYGKDEWGEYAVYRLRPGESLYSAVVVRFTDCRGNENIMAACRIIQRRNGISDPTKLRAGQEIRIPLNLLADRYKPPGTSVRDKYEEMLEEVTRCRNDRIRSTDLSGVLVIVDPGHGGADFGWHRSDLGFYEDELNYDMACRLKRALESNTKAEVFLTVYDRSEKYEPNPAGFLRGDTDEVLSSVPPCSVKNQNLWSSLRPVLVNARYAEAVRTGTDPYKVVLISLHAETAFGPNYEGSMFYTPSVDNSESGPPVIPSQLARFQEARTVIGNELTATEDPRRQHLSYLLADYIFQSACLKGLRGEPESSQVRCRHSGDVEGMSSLLRQVVIPICVHIETANVANSAETKRAMDSDWRQAFAETIAAGIIKFYSPD